MNPDAYFDFFNDKVISDPYITWLEKKFDYDRDVPACDMPDAFIQNLEPSVHA